MCLAEDDEDDYIHQTVVSDRFTNNLLGIKMSNWTTISHLLNTDTFCFVLTVEKLC